MQFYVQQMDQVNSANRKSLDGTQDQNSSYCPTLSTYMLTNNVFRQKPEKIFCEWTLGMLLQKDKTTASYPNANKTSLQPNLREKSKPWTGYNSITDTQNPYKEVKELL